MDSLRQVRTIAAQPALARFKPAEWRPGIQFQTDTELANLAGEIATTIFHPVGTARMGNATTILIGRGRSPRLRVRGVDGPARSRRQHHADHHQRQHQRPYPGDCRESGAMDRGGGVGESLGGGGRIRTSVLIRGQIYSLLPLTTRPPLLRAPAAIFRSGVGARECGLRGSMTRRQLGRTHRRAR